tara:strand:+ start:19772 stop:20476 length:705 start_codon:yes stop_codon:yes gene_type:complete
VIEAGKRFRHLVQFNSGAPTSDLTYTLLRSDGSTVLTETVPVASGQLSYLIEIPGGSNTVSTGLFEELTLEWDYTTATEAILDSLSYTVHASIGFPATREGVRLLLGVDKDELPDEEINLFQALMAFRSYVGEDIDLSVYQNTGGFEEYKIKRAIEAVAALEVFNTIQIRLPKKYDSGTSAYERWNTVDWDAIRAALEGHVAAAYTLLDPTADAYPLVDIFVLSDRGPDAITGE